MKRNKIIGLMLLILTSCTIFNKNENKSLNMNIIINTLKLISNYRTVERENFLLISQDYAKLKFWTLNDERYKYEKKEINNLKFEIIENKNTDKVIYLLHGGAFYVPLVQEYNDMMYYITSNSETKPTVYMLDYSVYPEKYPKAHNEAYEGYLMLLEKGYKSENIIILGDSAGGHLAVSLINKLKNEKKKLPKGIVLFSPWLDIDNKLPSRKFNLYNDILIGNIREGEKLAEEVEEPFYFKGDPRDSEYVNPLKGNFQDYPFTYIQVDSTEILLDDARELYVQIKKANKNKVAWIDIFSGNIHDFQLLNTKTKESKQALNRAIKRIDSFYNKEKNDR